MEFKSIILRKNGLKTRIQVESPEFRSLSVMKILSAHSAIFSTRRKQREAKLVGASSRNALISQDGISV